MTLTTPISTPGLHVVVAGAGPAGLATALLLAKVGCQVVVIEQSADPGAVAGAGLLLQPNALAVLDGLGLGDAIARRATSSFSIPIRDGRGRTITELAVPDFGDGLDHVLAVRRSHLARVLLDAVLDTPEISLVTGARVLMAAADGVISVDRVDSDDVEDQRVGLIVGADGVGSRVRTSGAFGARVRDLGRTYLRGIVDGEPDVPGGEMWTAAGLFGSAPLGDGSTYFYADVTEPRMRAAARTRDLEALTTEWRAKVPAATALIDAIRPDTELIVTRTARVDTDRYVDGRLVLTGDAAHAMAPTLGQGANSAFVDAAVLAESLVSSPSLDDGLARYDHLRRPAVQAVQRASDRAARAGAVTNALGRAVRDGVARRVSAAAGERAYRAALQVDPADLRRRVLALVASDRYQHRGSAPLHDRRNQPRLSS